MSKQILSTQDYLKEYKKHPHYIEKSSRKCVSIPFDELINPSLEKMNVFILEKKQAYYTNTEEYIPYVNYFIEYYDNDNELLMGYLKIKTMIERVEGYSQESFMHDLYEYILSPSMINKIKKMVRYNYKVKIKNNKQAKSYTNFEEHHGFILLDIAMAMKIMIPLITHYASVYNLKSIDPFTLDCFIPLFKLLGEDVNIYNKMYEFIRSKLKKTIYKHAEHWNQIEALGENLETKIEEVLAKVIHDIMYKYNFDKNIISYNTVTIRNTMNWSLKTNFNRNLRQISGEEDEDGLSDIDKIEMNRAKFDETSIITAEVSIKQTIKSLCKQFDIKIEKKEREFYMEHGSRTVEQKDLIFQFFAKYFYDIDDLSLINNIRYADLCIILKHILEKHDFRILQHLLVSNYNDNNFKKLPKRLMVKISEDREYTRLKEIYKDTFDIIDKSQILYKYIGIFTQSTFYLVDFQRRKYLGEKLNTENFQDLIIYEIFKFYGMIAQS